MNIITERDINISFDYDGTINTIKGLRVFNELKSKGYNIRITTTRREADKNQDLWKLCDELEIDNVVFTNLNQKWDYLDDMDIHIDNDTKELHLISQYSYTIPLLITDEDFDEKLNNTLEDVKF